MLRIRNLSNAMQKRTLRVLYSQTLAHPYAGTLDARLRNTDGSFRAPLNGDGPANSGLTRTANTFTIQGGLPAGLVMVKTAGEAFVPANGANTLVQPFGLLANFVGGTLDDLQDNNEIGVWYGVGSVYEVLNPAFNDAGGDGTSLASAYAAATASSVEAGTTPAGRVLLYAGTDGRLTNYTTPGNRIPVAELVERRSAGVIVVKSLI